jgi:hypothetical protein
MKDPGSLDSLLTESVFFLSKLHILRYEKVKERGKGLHLGRGGNTPDVCVNGRMQ